MGTCLSDGLSLFRQCFVFVFIFQDRVSLCSFGTCPGTLSVDQAGLKLTEICLCLLECWDQGVEQLAIFNGECQCMGQLSGETLPTM